MKWLRKLQQYYDYNSFFALYENKLFINNYERIIDFSDTYLKISINNRLLELKGTNLVMEKMLNHELLIKGTINYLNYVK